MPVRNARPQALSPGAASIQASHLSRGAGLVDEHQACGIQIQLSLKPGLARGSDVGPVLLGRVGGFF